MISLDTNVLFNAFKEDAPLHKAAFGFMDGLNDRTDIAISEFVLIELYRLLRNSAIVPQPLAASDAVSIVQSYRSHPRWKIIGFPESGSAKVHDELWRLAKKDQFAYRRIFDARLALCLINNGVQEFATGNVKDFEGFGFQKVWNPLVRG